MLTLIESLSGKVLMDESRRVSVFDPFGNWVSDSVDAAMGIYGEKLGQLRTLVYVNAEITYHGERVDTWLSADMPKERRLFKSLRRQIGDARVKYDLYVGVYS